MQAFPPSLRCPPSQCPTARTQRGRPGPNSPCSWPCSHPPPATRPRDRRFLRNTAQFIEKPDLRWWSARRSRVLRNRRMRRRQAWNTNESHSSAARGGLRAERLRAFVASTTATLGYSSPVIRCIIASIPSHRCARPRSSIHRQVRPNGPPHGRSGSSYPRRWSCRGSDRISTGSDRWGVGGRLARLR